MDYYYLNLATYLFENFLNATKVPAAEATVVYGRPMKGHGWHGMTNATMVKAMAEQIRKTASTGGENGRAGAMALSTRNP